MRERTLLRGEKMRNHPTLNSDQTSDEYNPKFKE